MGNQRRGIGLAAVLWLGALVAAPDVIAAADSAGISAQLDGHPIPATAAGDYYCHDLSYPLMTCFSTAEALEQHLAASVQAGSVYVTIYSEPTYDGSYAHLSQDYDGLWAIGWNDRISSFKARNGESGRFYEDWYAGGDRYSFCCDQTEPVLGGWDDRISAVYRD